MKTFVRSTALTLVAFALALILPNTASAAYEGFADVPEDAACYESVMYLAEHGITKGTEANTFSPAQPVTVRQWAVMLCQVHDALIAGGILRHVGKALAGGGCGVRQNQCQGKCYQCQRCTSNDSSHRDILHILVFPLSDILR